MRTESESPACLFPRDEIRIPLGISAPGGFGNEAKPTRNELIEHVRRETLMRLHPMKDDLSEAARSTVIGLLHNRFADCVDVRTRTKGAWCNVNGPKLSGLNKLFEEINEEVEQNLDNIADRAAQLGGTAKAKSLSLTSASSLPEYALVLTPGRDQVTALADTLASLGKNLRQTIGQSYEFGDSMTANMFTRVSRGVDKWLWMVQAHLQEG